MDAIHLNHVQVTELTRPAPTRDAAKIKDAALQFEALLIGQLLRSARGEGGWLGSGSDSSSDCATSLGDQHFAAMLAQQGGLGLSSLIAQGLKDH
jgi:Rod binding domain-containing protein